MRVTLDHVTKRFGDFTAVNDFSAVLEDGQLACLLGPSGCGKSTLLNMLSGILPVTEGKVLFDQDDVTSLPPEKRGVGLVFQNYALYPHMTVLDNICFPLETQHVDKKERVERANEIAKLVHVDMLMKRRPAELSGGQQQRVAIARALVKNPRLLLLDEPLSNLDARLRLQTREEIRRIQKETGITTVFVTHDQEEAMSISDMIVVMKLGVVQQTGKPQEVYDDPANLFVAKFLGTPPINVFKGRVEGGWLYLDNERVLSVGAVPDQDVMVGIRPEGFIIDPNGPMHCKISSVEVMGRDVSVVSTHPALVSPSIRSIVDADNKIDPAQQTIAYRIKPHKLFIFDSENEERIPFEVK